MKTLIFAGSYREYQEWMRRNGRALGDPLYVYLKGLETLRGVSPGTRVVQYGTYFLRSDYSVLVERLYSLMTEC